MRDRRTEILDTALQVLAEQGMRGLTHRAVDQAAGLALGSTSYYFRTRDALVRGCLHRLLELDRQDVGLPGSAGSTGHSAAPGSAGPPAEPGRAGAPRGPGRPSSEGVDLDRLVEQATEACVRMVTSGAHRTLARYELTLHAVRTTALRSDLVEAGTELRGLIAAPLATLGIPEPAHAAEQIAAVLDGLVLTALVRGPHRAAELRAWLRPPLRRMLGTFLPAA